MTEVIVIGIVCLVLVSFNFCIVEIVGESMSPALNDKERYLCKRIWIKRKDYSKCIDRVFVFNPPYNHSRGYYVIKRLKKVSQFGKLWFEGDNLDASNDSRHYGYVKPKNVIGILIRKV